MSYTRIISYEFEIDEIRILENQFKECNQREN